MISICSKITQGIITFFHNLLGRGESASFVSKSSAGTLSSVFGDSKQELIKQQDRRLHLRALCILAAIIKSLVTWTKEIEKRKVINDNVPIKNFSDDDSSSILEANPVVIGKNPLHAVSMKQVMLLLFLTF